MSDDLLKAMKQRWKDKTPGNSNKPKNSQQGKKKPPEKTQDLTLTEKKLVEDTRKVKIHNEREIRNLIEKKLIQSILGELSHSIHTHFIDLSRRESATLAAIWGIPEKEREIERELSRLIERELNGVELDIVRLSDDKIFD